MSGSVTRLRVDDEAFLVASLIERCPKVMMLRELVQNAIDAAVLAPAGEGRVELFAIEGDGTRKLAIRNTGPGMDANDLFRMGDLAASLGKVHALDGNFGMGAKVASLTSNRLGLRYRSCRGFRVHEMTLGERGGVYGRIRRADPLTGRLMDVLDVTGTALTQGLPLDRDWTEVVLLGNHAAQDTVSDPFDGDPMPGTDWIATGLYYRFLRIPGGVELMLHPGLHRQPGARPFRSLGERFACFARHEAVMVSEGVVLHYLYDAPDAERAGRNATEAGALQDADSLAALAYRNELYDVRQGWMWSQTSPRFGLSFGVQHISVIVELPDNAAVVPDGYRQFLRYGANGQRQVEVTDFARLVAAHRPAWLLDLLRKLEPGSTATASVGEELQVLLHGLKVRRARRPQPIVPYVVAVPVYDHPPAPGDVVIEPVEDEIETSPDIVLLRDQHHVHERLLDGRAAGYDTASHELFVNMRYPAIATMAAALAAELHDHSEQERVTREARLAAEQVTLRRIGRALVHGLAKRDVVEGWNRWQLEAATSPEALTLAADDYVWSMPEGRAVLARALARPPSVQPGAPRGLSSEPGASVQSHGSPALIGTELAA
jgi:hypothetical protein